MRKDSLKTGGSRGADIRHCLNPSWERLKLFNNRHSVNSHQIIELYHYIKLQDTVLACRSNMVKNGWAGMVAGLRVLANLALLLLLMH